MSEDSESVKNEVNEVVTDVLINKVPIYNNFQSNIKKKRFRKRQFEADDQIETLYPKIICIPQNKPKDINESLESLKLKEPVEKVTIIERAVGHFTVVEDKQTLTNELNTSISVGPPFACKICQSWFINGSKLKVHYVMDHDRIHCEVCCCLFETAEEKETHLLNFHSWLFCEICQCNFTSYPTLLQHYDQDHDSTTCIFCGIIVQPKSKIASHMQKKHCVTKEFSKNPIAHFISTNESKGNFLCLLCEKSRGNDVFFGHMYSHHKISVASLLNMLVKENIKFSITGAQTEEEIDSQGKILPMAFRKSKTADKSKCPVCVRSYTKKITMPFHFVYCQSKVKCKYCNKTFETTLKCNTHMKKIHNKFSCALSCEKIVYKTEESLNSHYLTIHKKIQCRYCDQFIDAEEGKYNSHLIEQHKYKTERMKDYTKTLFEVTENEEKKIVTCCLCDQNVTLLCDTIKDLYSHYFAIHCVSFNRILQLITPNPNLAEFEASKKIWIKQEVISDEEESEVELSTYKRNELDNDEKSSKEEYKRSVNSIIKRSERQAKKKIHFKNESDDDSDSTSNNNIRLIEDIPKDFDFQQIEGILNSESETEDEMEKFEYICDLCGNESVCLLKLLTHLKDVHNLISRFKEIECEHCTNVYLSSFSYGKHLQLHQNKDVKIETFHCGCDAEIIFNCARKHILQTHSDYLEKYDLEKVGLKCRFCDVRYWKRTDLNEHEVSVHLSENEDDFLKCYMCLTVFSSQKCLKQHTNTTHSDSTAYAKVNYKCLQCSIVFPNIELIREHFEEEHPHDILFKCPVPNCFKTSKYKKYIKNHLKSPQACSSVAVKPDPCDICGRVSNSLRAATIHKLMKHKIERAGYQCRICREKYHTNEQRKLHYATAHPGQLAYTCLECGKGFASKSKLYEHRKSHKEGEKRTCPYCNKEFLRKDSYNEHLLIHIGPKHQCPHCPKAFTQRSNLTRHVRIHTGTKPYQCIYCEKRFSDKGACKSHERVHTKEEHCECSYCGKKFTKRQKLKYHMKFHTGEGLVTCDVCQKQFSNTYAYKEHKRSHNQNTLLMCECGKGYTKEKYLLQHRAVRHSIGGKRNYVCPICQRISYSTCAYVDHVMTHSNTRHIKCTICKKEYNLRKTARKHVQLSHNIETLEEAKTFIITLTPEQVGLTLPPDSDFLTIYNDFVNEKDPLEIKIDSGTQSLIGNNSCVNDGNVSVKAEVHCDDNTERIPKITRSPRKPVKKVTVKKEIFSDDDDEIFQETEEEVVIETRAKRKVKKPVRYGVGKRF